jgi:hypothetical protein
LHWEFLFVPDPTHLSLISKIVGFSEKDEKALGTRMTLMYVNFEEIMRDKGALIIYLVGGYGDFTF